MSQKDSFLQRYFNVFILAADSLYTITLPLSLALIVSFFCCQGFLKLSVWLYLDPRNNSDFNHTENDHTEEQMLEAGTAGETQTRLCDGNMAELRSAGQVEISDEATLEDLKTQVAHEGYEYNGRAASCSTCFSFLS